MSLFSNRKPRPFHHEFIYVDTRREHLAEVERRARQQLGMDSRQPASPDRLIGTFSGASAHLVRQQSRQRRWGSSQLLLMALVLVVVGWLLIYC